jgi:5-methylcytosine-specific restriction protein A
MRYCLQPGCGVKVDQGYCPPHTQANGQRRRYVLGHAFYNTARWKGKHGLRNQVRQEEPLCRACGRVTEHIDHIEPHRNNEAKFFDRANLQGLCAVCHAEKTARGL